MNWKDFFDSIGLNGTKWQWRIMRWQNAWADRRTTLRQQRGQVTYQHKFCSCGALLDQNEKECPHCGKRAPSWRAQVMKRAVGLVVPSALAVSSSLLIVNSMFFLLMVAIAGASALVAPPVNLLAEMGGMIPARIPHGAFPTFITYGYLHLGLIHFGFNMLVLSQVGPMLEQEIGKGRFFSLYTLALIGGGVARYLYSGPAMMVLVGASGALFGLIGFGISYAQATGGYSGEEMRNFFVRWAIYGFLFGFLVGADNVAHLGGFLVGLGLGFLVERERVNRDRFTPAWNGLAVVCLMATLGAFLWVLWRHMNAS